MRLPGYPRKGQPIHDTMVQVIDYLRSITVRGITGGAIKRTAGGTNIEIRPRGGTTATASRECPFGEIITYSEDSGSGSGEEKTSIRGGIIYCGDKTWQIAPQELNLEAEGKWLVWITVSVEVNRDDDNVVILPGIKTGTMPTGDWDKESWDGSSNEGYPDNENPDVEDGLGTIRIPIGVLTITEPEGSGSGPGTATLEAAGCGNIVITQCAGILSHSRV